MNIIVSPYTGNFFRYRPDSTLIRSLSEYFIPDYVETLSVVPILFLKTHRAGKAISPRFASRYMDSFGFGLLFYPEIKGNFESESDRAFIANSLDYTTLIPLHSIPLDYYSAEHNFEIEINGKSTYFLSKAPEMDLFLHKFSEISTYCSIRIGDYIAFELNPAIKIRVQDHVRCRVSGLTIYDCAIR